MRRQTWPTQAVLFLCLLHCTLPTQAGLHVLRLHEPGAGLQQQMLNAQAVLQQQQQHKQQHQMQPHLGRSAHTAEILLERTAAAVEALGTNSPSRLIVPAATTTTTSSSSSSSTSSMLSDQHATTPQRLLLQYRPSQREGEQHKAAQDAGHLSGRHAAGVAVLSILAMAVLGFIGYKAMQWYERALRPGYVELQALDATFHRPTFTL